MLGVNAFNIALPALICGLLIAPRLQRAEGRVLFVWGALAGALGVLLTGLLVAGSLIASGPEYLPAGQVMLVTYLPLLLVEAMITATVLAFIKRVSPELLMMGRG